MVPGVLEGGEFNETNLDPGSRFPEPEQVPDPFRARSGTVNVRFYSL